MTTFIIRLVAILYSHEHNHLEKKKKYNILSELMSTFIIRVVLAILYS